MNTCEEKWVRRLPQLQNKSMRIFQTQRKKRHRRIRSKIFGTQKRPRLCVFRSNTFIYIQLIDDSSGKILYFARGPKNIKGAQKVGDSIAKKAQETGIIKVVFDRGGYKYHGRIKALAEGARAGGLKF